MGGTLYQGYPKKIVPLYGKTLAERPPADEVEVGTAFVLVESPVVVYISDGVEWKVQ
jgi:hypothetical protein